MIEYFDYKDRNNYESHICEKCKQSFTREYLSPHHVYGVRYSDLCIWLCLECHNYVQTHPAYAFKHGFSLERDLKMAKKEKKSRKCSHSVTYYNAKLGGIVCQFCGQEVNNMSYGKKKEAKPIEKKSKKVKKVIMKTASTKMGFESTDPRIAKASKLKTQHDVLKVKIKKEKDPVIRKILKIKHSKIVSQMRELQGEFQN